MLSAAWSSVRRGDYLANSGANLAHFTVQGFYATHSQLTLANLGGFTTASAPTGAFPKYTTVPYLSDRRKTAFVALLFNRITTKRPPVKVFDTVWIQVKRLPVAAILNSLNLKSDLSGKEENLRNTPSSLAGCLTHTYDQ